MSGIDWIRRLAAFGFGLLLCAILPAFALGQREASIHASVTVVSDGPVEVLAETERQIARFSGSEHGRHPAELRAVTESGVAVVYTKREQIGSPQALKSTDSERVVPVEVQVDYLRITVAYTAN